MVSTGRPWDELEDTLTFPRLEALMKYWRRNPPAHMLLKAFTGYKAPPESLHGAGAMGIEDFFRRIPGVLPSDANIAPLISDTPDGVMKRGMPDGE